MRVRGLVSRILGLNDTVYLDDRVLEYRGYWSAAAARLSASFEDLTGEAWEVTLGNRRTRFVNYITEADDPVTLHLAGDKPYCIELARGVGLPVATVGIHEIHEWDEIMSARDRVTGPLVVKPAFGYGAGLGCTTQIESRRDLERAAILASLYDTRVIVERFVPGESCRLLYLDGELIHAVRRRGVRVTGDGASSIEKLLQRDGFSNLKGEPATTMTLAARGLTWESIVPEGKSELVRYLPLEESKRRELRTVYNESITDEVSDVLREEVGRMVRALGSHLVGVDIVTNDPSVSLAEAGGVFLEANTTPAIHHHYITQHEREHHPIAVKVLEYLLHRADESREGHGIGAAVNDYNSPRGA